MANTTIVQDLHQYTKDDLIDIYEKLAESHLQLKRSQDGHLQQIHELKRSLQTATNTEAYLTAELDSIVAVHSDNIQKLKQTHLAELDAMKRQHEEAEQNVLSLEGELEAMRNEIVPLRHSLKELKDLQKVEVSNKNDSKLHDKLDKLEDERLELITKLEEVHEQLTETRKQALHHEIRIEDLLDQLECTKSTLDAKREELEEKTQLLETAQEQAFQLNTELNTLKSDPEVDHQKRGNSLFAEVDDQRQHMRQILAQQSKHFRQMKQMVVQLQQENRSLKREKAAMQKETQICASVFQNADQTYKEKLNERIGQVLADKRNLEAKLRCFESMLSSIASEKGVTWMDSMLQYCKTETKQLKDMLQTCRFQKCMAEDTVHNVNQEMARWRFEALKSRCLIINRETLLEEHKIPFNAEVKNIAQLVKKLDTPTVRPIIEETPSRILQPLPVVSETHNANQSSSCNTSHVSIDSTISLEMKSPVSNVSVLPMKNECDVNDNHNIDVESNISMANSVQIKTEVETSGYADENSVQMIENTPQPVKCETKSEPVEKKNPIIIRRVFIRSKKPSPVPSNS